MLSIRALSHALVVVIIIVLSAFTSPVRASMCRSIDSRAPDSWCQEVACAPVYSHFCTTRYEGMRV
jgi:hypothetical protein